LKDGTFGDAGLLCELGGGQAGGGGELLQPAAELAGDGLLNGTRLPCPFSPHGRTGQRVERVEETTTQNRG